MTTEKLTVVMDEMSGFNDYIKNKRLTLPILYKCKTTENMNYVDVTYLVRKAYKWLYEYIYKNDYINKIDTKFNSDIYRDFIEENFYDLKIEIAYGSNNHFRKGMKENITLTIEKEDITEWFKYIFYDIKDFIYGQFRYADKNIIETIYGICNSAHSTENNVNIF